ncbi:ComF family protein [Bombilactobacillus folatiphilus]|uniref:ComF family protein n=1 Tax=Bombilactobacillus folatiphilus TaxID=2923362 RepID=A0ABY4P7T2_9LACO|nr:ComF family protein [Bombilactobacillus folatiphilus]UQS81698.1 ComF family protein [Bombilactobacillus folatiphilus]
MVERCLLCQSAIIFELKPSQILGLQAIDPLPICQQCLQEFSFITPPYCPKCFKPNTQDICHDCQLWQQQGYQDLTHQALFRYNEAMHDYFKRYKRYGDYQLRNCFQKLLAHKLHTVKGPVIYIPSAKDHLQQRQFDPVVGLFKDLVTLTPALVKLPTPQAQAQKNRQERLQTPQFLRFNQRFNSILQAPQILIVDDIYTTGRTILHAYDCLRQVGFQGKISSFSLAR